MPVPVVTRAELEERLTPLLEEHPEGAVVFDADGTLWSHDVGYAVFEEALEQGLLRPELAHALREEHERFALPAPTRLDTIALGRSLLEAYAAGRYAEKAAAELMVWAYLGFSEAELRELTRRALEQRRHEAQLHREVLALADWARSRGALTFVVSASPRLIVEEATRALGFSAEHVSGGVANEDDGVYRFGMRHPLPYGPTKVTAGRALVGERAWLATFGDSDFDLDMLRAARLAIGIGEKSTLATGLEGIPNAVRLAPP